jgi:hypothetical protein
MALPDDPPPLPIADADGLDPPAPCPVDRPTTGPPVDPEPPAAAPEDEPLPEFVAAPFGGD